ncbi:hypothetical protein KKG83_05225 [Candidatus Micrarchaeota archaeon]|nr:hypothetical protein [Candidatus Micrarchaeota archaeon]MBU2476845.1 hypothetical protein [Candidatus Micrarchaeota archaeon]
MHKKIFLFLIFLLVFPSVFAVLEKSQMKLFAVTTEGIAVSADLTLEIEPGSGKVWSSVEPLVGTTTQSAERTAVQLASNYSSETKKYDFKFDIDSDASIVEGPSAGAAMALLTISMLQDKKLSSLVGITGTISEQGRVGPVGGVFAKAEEANRIGLKLFMIPKGEARQVIKEKDSVKTINLVTYAEENWSMKVVEVSTIDEVLKYAFSEIADINASTSDETTEINEFLPKPLPDLKDLKIMKELSKRMLDEAKLTVSGARNALANTSIEDSETVNFLLSTLNSAEQSLTQGETLYEKNYLYSAANNVFIAKVYASLVKDVAENPSILKEDSKLFALNVDSLKKNIEVLKENLDSFVPIDFLEWHIAAKQRLLWAKINTEKIEQVSQIVIDVGAVTQDSDQLSRIEDYEFAVAWYETARELYDKTSDSKKKVVMDDAFRNYSENYIIASENSIGSVDETEKEDILRRLDSARKAEEYSWFMVTAFDSASSYALIKASIESKDLSLDEAYSLLESKINAIDSNLSAKKTDEHVFVWARLYLDHAKYFLRAADFYKEQGYASTALERVKSGLSLIYLSEELFTVSDSVYSYYDSFTEKDFIGSGIQKQENPEMSLIDSLLIASAFVLLVLILIVAGFLIIRKTKEESLEKQLDEIMKLKRKSDQAFFEGKISEEKHNELNKDYSFQLQALRAELGLTSRHLIQSEEKKEEARAKERAISDLKKLKAKKLISLQEYNLEYAKLFSEGQQLKRDSAKEIFNLKKEKIDATKKTTQLKEKTKKVLSRKQAENKNK